MFWRGIFLGLALVLGSQAHAALTATNIAATDGSGLSLLNANGMPIVISNIHGLAETNPAPPGDNRVLGGVNRGADTGLGDTYFQSTAQLQCSVAGCGAFSAPYRLGLFEALDSGFVPDNNTVGDVITWRVKTYDDYDGSGVITPTEQLVDQFVNDFAEISLGIRVSVSGNIVAGDKFIAVNSGASNWNIYSLIDIDGDGIPRFSLAVFTENFGGSTDTSQDFNFSTLTLIGWEIDATGNFTSGKFDVTFDEVTTRASTWPEGDGFDVVSVIPIPAALPLLGSALGLLGFMAARRRRKVSS